MRRNGMSILVLTSLASVLFGPGAAAQTCTVPTFGAPVDFPVSPGAGPAVIADVNGDRHGDVLIPMTDSSGLGLFVMSGDAAGNLGAPSKVVSLPGTAVSGIPVVADFNGDGRADLALAVTPEPSLFILLGNGAGGFSLSTIPVGSTPSALAAGDLNGDHRADLVLSVGNAVAVLLGNGGGGFALSSAVPLGTAARSIAVGHFDGDGRLDVIVGAPSTAFPGTGALAILRGNGAGGLTPPTAAFPLQLAPFRVLTADLDGDGIADVVAGTRDDQGHAGQRVSVLRGTGTGGLGPETAISQSAVMSTITDVVLTEANGDGRPDVAISRYSAFFAPGPTSYQGFVEVHLGDGAGGFDAGNSVRAGSVLDRITSGDVDGDGRPDLVLSDDLGTPREWVLLDMCGNVADVAVTLTTSPDPVVIPGELAFVARVVNNGPDAAGVRLSMNLLVSRVEPSGSHCVQTTDVFFHTTTTCSLNLTAAPPGNAATFRFVQVWANPPTFSDPPTATAVTTVEDPVTSNNSASRVPTVLWVGGNGFRIQMAPDSGPTLTWTRGPDAAGYFIARWVGGTATILPSNGVPLPPDTTSFTDAGATAGQLNCYVVAAVDGSNHVYGYSQMLCAIPGTASHPPLAFSVGFRFASSVDETTVTLQWVPSGTPTGYRLDIYPLDGSPSRSVMADSGAADDTHGTPTCYVLVPLNGTTPLGHSAPICAVPGVGTFPP